MNSKIYLPGLNGIRAIAAMAVVIAHINNRLEYFNLPKGRLLEVANYGVTMFFTLSGFLITYLLLKEVEKTGTIDVKKFYVRRVLRIWPLYFLYLISIILVNGPSNVGWPIWLYLLMLPNLFNSVRAISGATLGSQMVTYQVGHYWSLGVEEQFYAFWPWIVRKKHLLLKVLVVFPIAYVILKVVLNIMHAPYSILVFVNYTRFGCLVLGGLGAYMFFYHKDKLKLFNNKVAEFTAWAFFAVVALNKFHFTSAIDHEIFSVATLAIIFNQVNNSKRLIPLENPVFDYLGKISYGLYVYNPLVICLMSLLLKNIPVENALVKTVIVYVLVIPAIVAIAHISYYYFEKRFLTLKTKYMMVQSAASRAEAASSNALDIDIPESKTMRQVQEV